ncbi:NADPH-dependent F420 reductase [Neisseria perflava]|uniref:NADPH-dependent F420 reductase n=1 Tax=Neisseria perflava TaxID=33053 RepID=UPI0020A02CD4|nr:NADPH-dependent F420 reductase [Neisseria perflava]MCP1661334.1 putative dinucleotide-binding enzyme [Neisseria perflava]MCP1771707.1 putative dinucleotide-binding enzyme [Neisseria perflava]
MNITIFGNGNMAQAIGKNFSAAGNQVAHIGREAAQIQGDIVVLAVPFPAVDDIISRYADQLAGKTVIDITNPVDFATMDALTVPAGTSAAELIQTKLPQSVVVKGFNTNFAATLAGGEVAPGVKTTVQLAGDNAEAKAQIQTALSGSGLQFIDAGSLKRARKLEAMGFLQITLAVREQISWTNGFAVYR